MREKKEREKTPIKPISDNDLENIIHYAKKKNIYIYIYIYAVSHRSEYTPHVFVNTVLNLLGVYSLLRPVV